METKIDEAKLKDEFASDANLRREFGNDFESFFAFSQAEAAGRIQISRRGSSGPVTAEQFHAEVQVEGLNRKIAANEAELKRLSGLQKKSAAENEAQYAAAEPCAV